MKRSASLLVWLGGTASTPTLGLDLRPSSGSFVNVWHGNPTHPSTRRATAAQFQPSATSQLTSFAPPERRQLLSHIKVGRPQWSIQKFHRVLRADIYDELLKLPLRYALHDFDTLERHLMGGRRNFMESHVHPGHRLQVQQSGSSMEASPSSSLRRGDGKSAERALGHDEEEEGEDPMDEVSPGVYAFPPEGPSSAVENSSSSPTTPSLQAFRPPSPSSAVDTDGDAVVDGFPPPDASPYYSIMGHQPSAVGYAPPLGPADPLDTIPFFVHRTSTGLLPGRVHSMDAKRLMPAFYLRIGLIDGDIFRFEEELLKIFPTKKIFVRRHAVYVYNVNLDGKEVLFHWLLGLGF